MINRQARRFTEAGYAVFILDLFGSGDSEGDFAEATPQIWQQDILAAISWLNKTSDNPPILWAMRAGALLTMDLIQKAPDITDQLILWSPVVNGKRFITQFMRIKLAAEVTNKSNGSQLTLKDMWQDLDSGKNIEIAGYNLSPELAYGISSLSLNDMTMPQAVSLKWIETSLSDPARLSPASQKVIENWNKKNLDISSIAINDLAFWALQEPEWADLYIDQTMRLLTK